jgi:purine-nucleoside phosphorylase
MRGTPDPRSRDGDVGDPRGEIELVHGGHAAAHVPEALAAIRAQTALVPRAAVILGSGLGPVAAAVTPEPPGSAAGAASDAPRGAVIPTAEIPFWPHSTVPGHAGRLLLGYWGGVPVALLSGRSHRYEGYGLDSVTFSVRVFHALGARLLFLTNAVGSMNPRILPGSLMLVRDHLNWHGTRGLFRPGELAAAGERGSERPAPLYSPRLIARLQEIARERRVPLAEGVLMGGLGPAYETAAEIATARRWGADAACMSTVTEVLVGAGLGMEVAVISCVTNLATGLAARALTHEEVIEVSDRAAAALGVLLGEAVAGA